MLILSKIYKERKNEDFVQPNKARYTTHFSINKAGDSLQSTGFFIEQNSTYLPLIN